MRLFRFVLPAAIILAACGGPANVQKTECAKDTDCDDSNACTNDTCTGGKCDHAAVTSDDGNACTTDSCDKAAGVTHTAVATDDGDACTADACDPATGVTHTAIATDDGNACTTDACDPTTGVTHTAVSTDDNDACTTDACDPATGVSHTAVATDDGDACTTDACDPTTGVTHTAVNPDDNNVCTTDSCDPTTGVAHVAVNTNDNNACTTDSCDPATGVAHTPVSADDGDQCTNDTCDPTTGIHNDPIALDDNNACTTDQCNPQTGPVHTPIATTDNNACTTDTCDPANGNITHVDTTDDNNACTTDACDPSTGVTHTPIATTDNNACTTDSCDPATGNITHVDTTNDNNVCTTDTCDQSTGVTHTPVNMDDGVSCTVDACDPQTGVSHTPNNNACEQDGFTCTSPVCNPTTGCSEVPSPSLCDDSSSCTADSCVGAGGDPSSGCKHQANDTLCSNLLACTSGGCGGAPVQAGHVIVTEFRAVGAEFIEVKNTGTTPVDLHGFEIRTSAGVTEVIRATSDRNNSANTPVTIAGGARAWGIANPNGFVTGSPDFLIGNPGSTFSLADNGDYIQLFAQDGSTEDIVDFRQFVTDPNVAPGTKFVGFNGRSTQLDPTAENATANDDALKWCVTFYGTTASPRRRVTDTVGGPNGSCGAVVINEALIDVTSTDDGKVFVELAGPGGAVVAGLVITDVEGSGTSAGTLNTDTNADVNTSDAGVDADGELTLPPGTRIPADGILLIADGINGATGTPAGTFSGTNVANVTAADLVVRDMDLENNSGESIQLLRNHVAIDVLGHDPAGNALAANVDKIPEAGGGVRGQPMWETPPDGGTIAVTPITDGALARDNFSSDSDNNRVDFHGTTTPTPGAENDVGFVVTSISPDDILAGGTGTAPTIVLAGNGFVSPTTVKFGATAATCTNTNTRITCTAPPSATVSRVDVTVQPPLWVSAPVTLKNAFTYTGVLNGTTNPQQADFCNLQSPQPAFSVATGQPTTTIYGQLYEQGATESAGPAVSWSAEVGYGATASDPTTQQGWLFFPASYNVQAGNNDEYQASFTAPAAGTYSYTYRVSVDNGLNYTYCDIDGAGSNAGLTFSTTQLGTMTVTP